MPRDRVASKRQTCNIEASFPPKPQRPLTCYGIFSVLERNYIWQQNTKQSSTTSNESHGNDDDPYTATRPQRYRDIELPPNWWVVGMNRKKRNDHIVHGKVTFNELSKSIAERWRTVDDETKSYCEMIANEEHKIYQIELEAYIEIFGEEAVKAQTAKRLKPSKSQMKNEKPDRQSDTATIGKDCTDHVNTKSVEAASAEEPIQFTTDGISHATKPQCQYSLLDYLSDDRSAALNSLAGNNHGRILGGDELKNTLDSFEEDSESRR